MLERKVSGLHGKLTDAEYPKEGGDDQVIPSPVNVGGATVMANGETIRAVLYREGNLWVGQCLEYDIGVQAADLETLRTRLLVAIKAECNESLERAGKPFGGINAAPDRFHTMWASKPDWIGESEPSSVKTDCAEIGINMAIAA